MNLNKPKPFTPSKNQIAKDWQRWKEEFVVFLRLSNAYTQFTEEQRALLLINFMGTEAIKAMEEIHFGDPNEKKDMDILLAKFDEFFNPVLNEVEERYKFFSRRKIPDEDLDKYILDLKERAERCNFGNQSEKFIIDMLVLSVDKHLRELIWASKSETLPEIISNYKQYNITRDKMKELSENAKQNLESEKKVNAKANENDEQQPEKHIRAHWVCSKCGLNHPFKQCPAFDAICQKCRLRGHYTKQCEQAKLSSQGSNASKEEKIRPKTGRTEPLSKGSNVSKEEQSKPTTSRMDQNPGHTSKPASTLQKCLWCDTYHVPAKCPHNPTCTACNNFPHKICFNCKENPHHSNCYFKSIVTLPSTQNTNNLNANQHKLICLKCGNNHGNTSCKYCTTCQIYGHWDNECPRKNYQPHNGPQPDINNLVDGFVEIGNAYRRQAQPQRQVPTSGPSQANQPRRNTPSSNNTSNKNGKSDACCIS